MAVNCAIETDSKLPAPSQNQAVQLKYIQWRDEFHFEKPYEFVSETPDGLPRSNFSLGFGPVETIHDLRGRETEFDLDNHAFEIRSQRLTVSLFDQRTIEKEYLPSIVSLLQELDPGAEVYIFDWRLRSSDRKKSKFVPGAVIDLDEPLLYLEPVHAVHVDQSPAAARKRVWNHMGDRAQELIRRRFRIINVWRPLLNTIENFPLAVCDGSTLSTDRLLAVDHVRKYYVGESLYPMASAEYRWYYLGQQTKDEVLLFKTFDSSELVPAKCCPHTSFAQSGVRAEANPRESIEVRALVFSVDNVV
ncbi:putative 7 alpha-cephem-methoxylase [Xylariaceae sp. FL1651]|nr:putative 7 alpha-cephem-methoxylase [Xylariaceae sp. FL1651]